MYLFLETMFHLIYDLFYIYFMLIGYISGNKW